MKSASSIIIVLGYGMAVALAQHAQCEMEDVMNQKVSTSATPTTRSRAACPVT